MEIKTQIQIMKVWAASGESGVGWGGGMGGMNWEFWIDIYTLICIK